MQDKHPEHEQLVQELRSQLEPIFEKSPQAVYLYLDDAHKTCNQKFADLLGYNSIDDWVSNSYPVEDIKSEDQPKVIEAYTHVAEDYFAVRITATAIRKSGEEIDLELIMVPITYKDEVFVLHYISPS